MLIAIEGLDHCGKSQLTALLQQKLRQSNLPVRCFSFKSDKCYRQRYNNINEVSAYLHFTLDRQQKQHSIRTALSQGNIVLIDRYTSSGMAYYLARAQSYFRNEDWQYKDRDPTAEEKWCRTVDSHLLTPTLTLNLRKCVEKSLFSSISVMTEHDKFTDKVIDNLDDYSYCTPDFFTIFNTGCDDDDMLNTAWQLIMNYLQGIVNKYVT